MGLLRYILATLVLVSHLGHTVLGGINPGVSAVIVFYMLAGHVVAGLWEKWHTQPGALMRFYADRLWRIWPQYALVCCVAGWLWWAGAQSPFLAQPPNLFNWLAQLTVVPLAYYMYTGAEGFVLVPPAWSLGVELQFYLLAPFLVLLPARALAGVMAASLAVFAAAQAQWLHADHFGYRLLPGVLFAFLSGAGNDLLRYSSSGGQLVSEAGFELHNVETVQVTTDAVGGTTFDVTGSTGIETLRNSNSATNLTLTGMNQVMDVELVRVGGTTLGVAPATTVIFNAGVLTGNNDSVNVLLNGNVNVNGTSVGALTVNGIETFNVTTKGAASMLAGIASNSLNTLNIDGDQDLTLDGIALSNTVGVNTVNAAELTGDLTLTLTNDGARRVAVTGGTGDDTVNFQAFDAGDTFDGGDGVDTIGLANAIATARTAANGGTLTNVEQLAVTSAGIGAINMDAFAGVDTVIYTQGVADGATSSVNNAVSGITVQADTLVGGTGNLTVDLKTDGAADVVNVDLMAVDAGDRIGTLTADDAETLNISVGDATLAGNGDLTIARLVLGDTTHLTLSGDADVTVNAITNPGTAVLSTFDASGLTGDLTIGGLNTANAGASITLGSGDDVYTVATSNGADTITLGTGADRIEYSNVAQSDRNMDTITDFVSGTDIVDVRALMGGIGFASSVQFVGNRATFSQAQGALSGLTADAVFDVNESILWVDVDSNGTLDNNDFRVKLNGVTSLTAADLGFVAGVTFTANKTGFQTENTADSVEGVATGSEDDVINASVAQINDVNTHIHGRGGNNVLNITGTAAAGEVADLDMVAFFDGVQTVNLANNVEGLRLSDEGNVVRLNGAAGKLQSLELVNATDLTGVQVTNIETLLVNASATINVANLASFSTITGDGSAALVLNGDVATDDFDFSGVAMSGITTLTLTQVDEVRLDPADLTDVTGINGIGDAALIVNGTVNLVGKIVSDPAVRSLAVNGNLTINHLVDGDQFETITGIGGNRTLTIAAGAGGATNIADLTGFSNITATALGDGEVVTLDDDLTDGAVAIAIGDSDLNVTGASTDDLTVNALGGVANQSITTAGGDDTVNIDVGATNATVATGDGDDIINAGGFLDVADAINGGAGTDTLNVTGYTNTDDLDNVTNVEVINISNAGGSIYTLADSVVAAGESIEIDASGSGAGVDFDFSFELDGQINYTASAAGGTITFAGNNLSDSFVLGAGVDVLVLDTGSNVNTIANLANVDSIENFKVAGADTLDTGTAHAAGSTYTLNIASSSLATFAGDVNTALAGLAGYAGAATDALVVTVGGGALAGTYLIQDLLGDGVTADDFVVELVGNSGAILASDFV